MSSPADTVTRSAVDGRRLSTFLSLTPVQSDTQSASASLPTKSASDSASLSPDATTTTKAPAPEELKKALQRTRRSSSVSSASSTGAAAEKHRFLRLVPAQKDAESVVDDFAEVEGE